MAVEAVLLRRGQEDSAAAALTASHANYPAFTAVFPDRARRLRALRPFFRVTVHDAIPFGSVHAAVDGPVVQAVAVWLPPGAFPWSRGRKARSLPAMLRVLAAYPRAFPAFTRYGANAERRHPRDEPHWYLEVLGVRPEFQRRGLGSLLIRPVVARADEQGVACFLETSDRANVAYYEQFGFSVVDDRLQLIPDGPAHVSMRRPPAG